MSGAQTHVLELSEFDDPVLLTPYAEVPQLLKNLDHWVTWKYETRDGKPTKVPYGAKTGRNAKVNDPSTWATFAQAESATNVDGIGFVLLNTSLVGIDFDGVVKDGAPESFVLGILETLGNPYCEITPSGNGLRAFVEATLQPGGKRRFTRSEPDKYGAEIYSGSEGGRYLTITGRKFSGSEILKSENISLAYFLVSQILNEKFKSLWTGDLSEYEGDHSRADLALIGILAKHFSRDPKILESAFSASKLGQRDKWIKRPDYRKRTIDAALKPAVAEIPQSEQPEAAEVEIVEEVLPEFPIIPGTIGELADALCPDIPREFKIMAAVTRVGLMLSGKVQLEGEPHLEPRFYTCMVAPPSSGKTASIAEVSKRIKGDFISIPSVDSGPALVDTFGDINKQNPSNGLAKLLLSPDEMKDIFEKAKASRDGRNSLGSEILKLFEQHQTGNRSRQSGVLDVDNAALAILGGATPDSYVQMWTGTAGAASGLQSRFTLVTTTKAMPERQSAYDQEEVSGIIGKLQEQIKNAPAVVRMTDEAWQAFQNWWKLEPRDTAKATRITDIVKRFLIVLAVTSGTHLIDVWLLKIGIEFGNYQIALREKFNPEDSSGWVQAFEQRILKAYRKHGSLTDNELRRIIVPERGQGGFGPYMQAKKNLVAAEMIVVTGRTQKAPRYGLSDGRTTA